VKPISLRLAAAADLVLPGRPVADIGADHGGLVRQLVSCDVVPSGIAVDVAEGPIRRLKHSVESAGLMTRIDVRQGDGLEPLRVGEVATVCILGMGGQTMVRILAAGLPRLPDLERLVLSPHTGQEALRRFLVKAGWGDVHGSWVLDRGHHYPVEAWERGPSVLADSDFRWGRAARSSAGSGLLSMLQAEHLRLTQAHAGALAGRGPEDPEVQALGAALEGVSIELTRLESAYSSSLPVPGAQ
jgi:tRNA (adenine22-N1)-methyltransferase